MKRLLYISIILNFCVLLNVTRGEHYNLVGNDVQAYSMQVNIGHPHQALYLLIDTGSVKLAIASYPRENNAKYFHKNNSTSIQDKGKNYEERYVEGYWSGRLVSDFIQIPSLRHIPEVRSDIGLITKSHEFFKNNSKWQQGILGCPYRPKRNSDQETWLDALDGALGKPMSFLMKLCGVTSAHNNTLYGRFDWADQLPYNNETKMYWTPVLKTTLFDIGVISVRVMTSMNESATYHNITRDSELRMCRDLNAVRSIIDSGSTRIRIPDELFQKVVDDLSGAYNRSQLILGDRFWNYNEGFCFLRPPAWPNVKVAVDLLSSDADNQYFTLEIPPQNYMRLTSVWNNSTKEGRVLKYCYHLGLERSGKETVLGYTLMEGYNVVFNRSAGWVGFQESDCGPDVRITGPHNASTSLKITCKLPNQPQGYISMETLQWALFVFFMSVIAWLVIDLVWSYIKMYVLQTKYTPLKLCKLKC